MNEAQLDIGRYNDTQISTRPPITKPLVDIRDKLRQ